MKLVGKEDSNKISGTTPPEVNGQASVDHGGVVKRGESLNQTCHHHTVSVTSLCSLQTIKKYNDTRVA